MFEIYRPSGRFGAMAIPMAIVGIVVAIAAAFVYHLLLKYIPLIYITFLITMGLGVLCGIVGSMVASIGKVRNVALAGLIGVLLTVSSLGAKYVYQYYSIIAEVTDATLKEERIPETERDAVRQAVLDQITFLVHLDLRAQQGWEIGRGGGLPIQGVFVYLIWLIEAGIVGYFAIKLSVAQSRQPYSEKMDAWASEVEIVMTLPITSSEMISAIRSATSVEQLLTLPIPETDESNMFANYIVNSIEGQELEDAYLSVDLVTFSVNAKGEQEQNEEPLVKFAVLTSEQRHQLVEDASLLQEALGDYRQAKMEEMAGVSDDSGEGGVSDLGELGSLPTEDGPEQQG